MTRRAYAAGARVVEITAKRFGLCGTDHAEKGSLSPCVCIAKTVTHGFFMRKLKIDAEVDTGKTTDVTITPSSRILRPSAIISAEPTTAT
jgi:hypothetical protein